MGRPSSRRRAVRTIGAAAFAAVVLGPPAASAAPRPADTVLRGGTIRTVDARFSVVRALAVVAIGEVTLDDAAARAACAGSSGRAHGSRTCAGAP